MGFTEAGGPGVLGAQICSVLIWGAGSGGLEPLGLGGGGMGPPVGTPPQLRLLSASLASSEKPMAFSERVRPGHQVHTYFLVRKVG